MERELFCFMPFFVERNRVMSDFASENKSAWMEETDSPFMTGIDEHAAQSGLKEEESGVEDKRIPESEKMEDVESETVELEDVEPDDEADSLEELQRMPDEPQGGSEENNDRAEEDKKRREHEAAEAKRKAEWEARQQEKKAAEQEQLNRLMAMSNEDVMAASMKRVSADTEKLTRRNMKECVSEYIQTKCLDDPAFARLAMHPRKTMVHCFWYINRKAREFIQQEMKDNDIKPENGIYGGDVPDDLCYQWAEDYFRDLDAKEDKETEDKFVEKPYYGKSSSSKSSPRKKQKKDAEKKPDTTKQAEKPVLEGQLSFIGQMSLPGFEQEVKAG